MMYDGIAKNVIFQIISISPAYTQRAIKTFPQGGILGLFFLVKLHKIALLMIPNIAMAYLVLGLTPND